ncbi:MAG: DNA repair protein RecO [Planctomycetes bacterium]|nr:DNA repair protein RecO [Planctomycetota bacterium]
MSLEKTEAVVLRLFEFSETSLVVHLLTRDLGRVHAIAKGARRAKPRGGEYLDLLVRAEVVLLRRSTAALATITDFAVRENYPTVRSSTQRLNAAYFLDELVHEVSRENEPNELLYAAAIEGLEGLEHGPAESIAATLLAFEARFLAAAGYLPELRRCVRCRRDPAPAERIGFSSRLGGLLCSRCFAEDPGFQAADRGALITLSSLLSIHGEALGRVRLPARTVAELRRLLDGYYEFVFERRLRTARFLRNDA